MFKSFTLDDICEALNMPGDSSVEQIVEAITALAVKAQTPEELARLDRIDKMVRRFSTDGSAPARNTG